MIWKLLLMVGSGESLDCRSGGVEVDGIGAEVFVEEFGGHANNLASNVRCNRTGNMNRTKQLFE